MFGRHLAVMTNLDTNFRSSFKVKYCLFTRTFNCTLLLVKVSNFVFFIVFHIDFSPRSLSLTKSQYFFSPIYFMDKKLSVRFAGKTFLVRILNTLQHVRKLMSWVSKTSSILLTFSVKRLFFVPVS